MKIRTLLSCSLLAVATSITAADYEEKWTSTTKTTSDQGTEVVQKRGTANGSVEKHAGGHEHTRDATVVIKDDEGTHTQKRKHTKTVSRDGEGGKNWQRSSSVKDSRGWTRSGTASGTAQNNGDGTGSASVTREGERSGKKGSVSWEEQEDRAWKENELGGRDTVAQKTRSNSKGKTVDESTQRQTKTEEDGDKAFREASTRVDQDGNEVQVYKEGRTQRRSLKDGFVDRSVTKGTDSNGKSWTREWQKEVRYQGDNKRLVREVTATKGERHTTYRIVEGHFTRLGNGKGWNYVGTVETRVDGKVTKTKQVNRHHRRLPIPEDKP